MLGNTSFQAVLTNGHEAADFARVMVSCGTHRRTKTGVVGTHLVLWAALGCSGLLLWATWLSRRGTSKYMRFIEESGKNECRWEARQIVSYLVTFP